MSLPSNLHDEANSHAGILVSAAESIHNEESLSAELLLCDILNGSPNILAHRMVVVLILIARPPYGVLGILIHNDVLVFGGTSGVDTGHYVNRTKLGLHTNLIAGEILLGLFLIQHLIGGIVNNLGGSGDAVLCQINVCHAVHLFLINIRPFRSVVQAQNATRIRTSPIKIIIHYTVFQSQ